MKKKKTRNDEEKVMKEMKRDEGFKVKWSQIKKKTQNLSSRKDGDEKK